MTIQRHQEISHERSIVDPRTFFQKFLDACSAPWLPVCWAVISGLVTVAWSGFFPVSFIVFLFFHWTVSRQPDTLPIHLPMSAQKTDLNDPKIGDNTGHYKSRGSFYLGKIRKTGFEVWVNFKALTQHFLIFGTTGSGKTESMVSMIANYLAAGSGVAFQDAKAAPKAMIQLATLARIFGRDDDFRVTNYITGLSSERRDPAERLSNDAAVFATGSADSSTQLLVSLMPPSEGENKLFSERAVALASAEFPALTDLRDMGVIQIDPGVIRRNMSFKYFVELFRDNRISKRSRDALQAYLESLPGYDENKDISEQPEEVTRQFGFAQAYFTRSLSSLSDTYGHIYMVGQGEIDYRDAVLNGRIILTLLPSMEKSGEELSNLGKIVLTALKNGMAVGLGTVFEGSAEDIVHNLPTNSEIPFGILNDETAYMLIEGQEIANAQGRGLGFGIATGTQDVPGMIENISKTSKQIMANSAFKQIGYLDDKETVELAKQFSGEARVLMRNQYERDGDFGNVYASGNVTLDKDFRISETDIKMQRTGEVFLMYQGKVHEVQVFNHGIAEKGPDPLRRYLDHWFPVRMPKVKIPKEDVILSYMKQTPRQDWEDLLLMLRDESRQMLGEMVTYFASQNVIRTVASLYADMMDDEGMPLTQTAFIAQSFLSDGVEPPSGLIKALCDNLPDTLDGVAQTMAFLARNVESSHLKVQLEADEANLDSYLDLPPLPAEIDDVYETVPPANSEASGGGAGGYGLMHTSDALSDFLGPEYAGQQYDYSESTLPDLEPPEAFTEQAPPMEIPLDAEAQSPWAKAVTKNLAMMPWMSTEVDYESVRDSIQQTEMLFNKGDIEAAAVASDDAIDRIIETLEYPRTKIAAESSNPDRARELFKDWIN